MRLNFLTNRTLKIKKKRPTFLSSACAFSLEAYTSSAAIISFFNDFCTSSRSLWWRQHGHLSERPHNNRPQDVAEELFCHQEAAASKKNKQTITCSFFKSFSCCIFLMNSKSLGISWYPFIPFSMEFGSSGCDVCSDHNEKRKINVNI